ncbi:L-glyceraldehyde 3-phosphate reductase [uncultured Eudoraea sp.]|uniref:L-glyceraldehyde 3-phosphate reductase n=1 Tax=uncultured Eudoraea sp. TaxID=1035614 RepID=UPI002623645F|nr:L-glyceraldehyde 3-phosphate reductase [uncultured Eudoraea sp.]
MKYSANKDRYRKMKYNRCGNSGLLLPAISLGLWHNFGGVDIYENGRNMVLRAFDLGITHFDLANNYGPPYGSAEETFGKILKSDLQSYRDELIITSKAGYDMWPGPYGEWGSRKYLIASCDQSLKRLGLDYVDIFYSHRPDPNTPLEETMMALDQIVRSGKALYAGISSYDPEQSQKAIDILNDLGTPCLVHQPSYSMFNRWVEDGLLDVLEKNGVGSVVFSPLFQGLLTNKYLGGIPEGSRASKADSYLQTSDITPEKIDKVKKLNEIAEARGQKMAQLALSWVLRDKRVTSVIIGASKAAQIEDAVGILDKMEFTSEELHTIEGILKA